MEIKCLSKIIVTLVVCFALATTLHASVDRATVFTGEIHISTISGGDIQVALDVGNDDEAPDGVADHLFILQRDRQLRGRDLWQTSSDARVVYARGRLTITAPGLDLVLAVDSVMVPPADGRSIVRGHGLSHHYGGFEISPSQLAQEDFFGRGSGQKFTPDGGGGWFCDAGGIGATQCSVSGCSGVPSSCEVTCSGGKFACCNCTQFKASCKCENPS